MSANGADRNPCRGFTSTRTFKHIANITMVVFHRARRGMGELFAKWDRHVWHELEALRSSGGSQAIWCLRALAIALSPLPDTWRVLASGRVSGARARALAVVALARVRLFRAALMLRLVLDREAALRPPSWNRP